MRGAWYRAMVTGRFMRYCAQSKKTLFILLFLNVIQVSLPCQQFPLKLVLVSITRRFSSVMGVRDYSHRVVICRLVSGTVVARLLSLESYRGMQVQSIEAS